MIRAVLIWLLGGALTWCGVVCIWCAGYARGAAAAVLPGHLLLMVSFGIGLIGLGWSLAGDGWGMVWGRFARLLPPEKPVGTVGYKRRG